MRVIGGEQKIILTSDNSIKGLPKDSDEEKFYSTGRTALYAILKHEISVGKKRILLPDYLCESITNTVIDLGMTYEFYHINEDLHPDVESIKKVIQKSDVILFINYFGVISCESEMSELKDELPDIAIVVDNVQNYYALGTSKCADYEFTSFRKWFPIPDGAKVVSRKCDELTDIDEKNNFFVYKLAGNILKDYNQYVDDESVLSILDEGEKILDKDYLVKFSDCGRKIYAQIDFMKAQERRIANAKYICKRLDEMNIAYAYDENMTPLFIPIFLEHDMRNYVRKHMFSKNIFCPIHWPNKGERISGENILYETELSLICDQRYGLEDMKLMMEELERASTMYKSMG